MMERRSPIVPYAEPPWHYHDVQMMTIWCRAARPESVASLLPADVTPRFQDGRFALLHLDVGGVIELGEHYRSRELALVVPVRHSGGITGGLIVWMLVDNDAALTAGREIWGHPKLLGRVETRQDANSTAQVISAARLASVDSVGSQVAKMTVTLDGSVPDHERWEDDLLPRLLVAPVRDSHSGRPSGQRVVVLALHDVVVHHRATGSAEVEIGSWDGVAPLTPVHALGASRRQCQFTLGYGDDAHQTNPSRLA